MEPALKPGQIFDDKFELQAVLGAGGIGAVYKAKQLDCDRTVALKLLHSHIAEDEEYRARFLREAKALSRLQHPNIVMVYHLGLSFSGSPYLAMELIRGKSIRRLISEQGRLPTKLALAITRDVALALAYVHKEGIIHRDLKPDNIIIVDEPNPNTVKIIDFGLIHYTDKDQKMTATNELIGTVDYMSPEQCAGKEITLHSDIYSLTVCLYEMLTGQKPFAADTPIGLMYKQINTPPPLIGSETVEMYHPILQELINTGLNKDPLKRYENMESFAAQIEECIALIGEGKYKRPRKFPVALIAGIALIVALACIPLFMGQSKRVSRDLTTEKHITKLSPSQEIESVRASLRDADNWYQRTLLYHRAFNIISKESAAARITRSTRLNLLASYAESLDNNNLPAPALALRDTILNEVRAKGLPGDISSEPFGNDQVAELTRDSIKTLINWNRKKEAQELLRKALNPPPRHFMPILESAIRLHDDKLTRQFINEISMPSEAIFGAVLLRQENNMPLLAKCLEAGRATSIHDETNEDSKLHSQSMFCVQDGFYWLMQGKNKKAIASIKKADVLNAGKMSPDKRRKLVSTAIIVLTLARDFEGVKALIAETKPDDAPNWNVQTFSPSKENYDIEIAKLGSLLDSGADRSEVLKQMDRLIASIKNPELQTLFLIQRAAKSRTDYIKVLYSTRAYDKSIERPALMTPATTLAAKSLYARALNSSEWKSESLRLMKQIIAEVKRSGLPLYGDHFNEFEYFLCQSLAANILAGWGQLEEARKTVPALPAQLDGRTPWREIFDTELILNNETEAARLLKECYEIYDFHLMSTDTLAYHNYKLAEICVRKCDALLAKERSTSTGKGSLFPRLIAATIRLDQGRAAEAQEYIKPILSQLPQYIDENSYEVRSLVVAADLSGLDVRKLAYLLEDRK
ncbi:MAG: serine/threonine protein kinase [Candidatus Obscuribacterales bacterium]|nr:serine/threonine protein kinase [Candidatus Obscuribacterales bacterium]